VGWGGAEGDHDGEVDQFGELGWSGSHRGKSMMVAADWRCAPMVIARTRSRGACGLARRDP
jgi:hypothetical protein